ncbi:unnamed protein product [Lupinus luteus]|uniref:GATA-type domain-containing protein n=1 Tax=Lupinus luteus TaxID=3873 RepID=A0AAV1WAY4_LUPLU
MKARTQRKVRMHKKLRKRNSRNMRKRGPCCHCGIVNTPLWRHGPKEKPILCNACGTRYKLKGTLENYLPRHCRQEQPNNNINEVKGKTKLNGDLLKFEIPSRKRSSMVPMKMTPMEIFQKQLLLLWESDKRLNESSEEEVLLSKNVNNFIPSNEIGLGAILLKPDGTST